MKENNYQTIRLGAKYSDLREAIQKLREDSFDVKGFGDMTVEEVSEIANMNIAEAEMAKERDFDEPFIFAGAIRELPLLFEAIRSRGFNYTQGRFFHILGNSDKGKAVAVLIDLYKKKFGGIVTIAIGDSPNDIPMLEAVNYPVIVQRPDGSFEKSITVRGVMKIDGLGSEGWNKAVLNLLKKYG